MSFTLRSLFINLTTVSLQCGCDRKGGSAGRRTAGRCDGDLSGKRPGRHYGRDAGIGIHSKAGRNDAAKRDPGRSGKAGAGNRHGGAHWSAGWGKRLDCWDHAKLHIAG